MIELDRFRVNSPVAFIFLLLAVTEHCEVYRCIGDNSSVFCCPWWNCLFFILPETDLVHGLQFTHHTSLLVQDNIRMTVSRWPDQNWTQTAEGKVVGSPSSSVRSVWLVSCFTLAIWQVHMRPETTETRPDPRSCKQLNLFLLRCVAAFGKSCQRLLFGLEPVLSYWIHHG